MSEKYKFITIFRQAIASTWAYSDVKRGAREFVKFNTLRGHNLEITLPMYGKLDDFVR